MTTPAATAAAVVADHYRAQQALTAAAALQAQKSWRQIDAANIASSWRALMQVLVRVLAGLQGKAAVDGVSYVGDVLAAAGVAADPIGTVVAYSLAGIASDGRDLTDLLQTPLIGVFDRIKAGAEPEQALQMGTADTVTIAATQVADAGRVATGLAMTNQRGIRGYVRVVHLPACGRCIILAGKEYAWSTGFLRHPRCLATARCGPSPPPNGTPTSPERTRVSYSTG